MPNISSRHDRNFDEISEHFAKKVYGGLKGEIRLAVLRQDIFTWVNQQTLLLNRPLRVLDVGVGLGQIAIELACQGHELTINDISENMLSLAQTYAHEQIQAQTGNMAAKITWHHCPYQDLSDKLIGQYDLILCHALLEWLAEPAAIMDFFDRWLIPDGALSLCFYNPASFTYRNLIMGNFNMLSKPNFQADSGSLTPNHPVTKDTVMAWLAERDYDILHIAGLRVFHDYAPLKRGGHTDPAAVIEMELRYSGQEPYKWLGRYLHVLSKKSR